MHHPAHYSARSRRRQGEEHSPDRRHLTSSMKITLIEHGLVLAANEPGFSRSSGLHLSNIYNSLFADLFPDKYGDKDGGPPLVKLEAGMAWEHMLEEGLKRRLILDRPGEFVTAEGIAYSPDALIFLNDPKAGDIMRLGEFKCTWFSIRNGIQDRRFDKWFIQMKGYCYNLDTPYARLYGFFVNGDYSWKAPMGGPQLLAFDIEFTARELQDNWTMLINHAKGKGMLS